MVKGSKKKKLRKVTVINKGLDVMTSNPCCFEEHTDTSIGYKYGVSVQISLGYR